MDQRNNKIKIILTIGLSFLLMTVGCRSAKVMVGKHPSYHHDPPLKGGPPPWAPAHGYRAKHRYLYYPSSYVYFDIGRKLYFYYSVGEWRVSATLPAEICIDVGHYVTLEMDIDKPYKFHQDVVKKHPPGHLKHKHKGKGKVKRKGGGAS